VKDERGILGREDEDEDEDEDEGGDEVRSGCCCFWRKKLAREVCLRKRGSRR